METPDPNIMPEINLGIVDKVRSAGQWLADHLSILPANVDLALSEHRGGASVMLDEALDYEQIETD